MSIPKKAHTQSTDLKKLIRLQRANGMGQSMGWCLALQGLPVTPSSWTAKPPVTLYSTVLATTAHQPVGHPQEKCQRPTGFGAAEEALPEVSEVEVSPFPRKGGHQET